jgi:RNA polymerase sigma-70 factor (ECF subfamily)
MIHKVCRLYGKTPEDRQDLFQEILVQAWKGFEKFKGQSKFSTWLYRVAINTAITGIRKNNRRVVISQATEMPDIADTVGDNKKEERQQLYTAIAKLNEIEKALVLLYLDERSYQEMETILGINEGTLRVKMNRVKEKLKQLLKN